MTDGVGFKLEGFDELERELKLLGADAEKVLRSGLQAGGSAVRKQARSNLAPHRRTGDLAKGLKVNSRIDRFRRSIRVTIRTGKNEFYGLFLEFGATGVGRGNYQTGRSGRRSTRSDDVTPGSGGTIAPIAWFRRAFRKVGPDAYNKYAADKMRQRIKKIRAKRG